MRKIYCLFPILLLTLSANAQFLGFSPAGIKQLKELDKTNPEIHLLIKQQKRIADQAVDTVPDPITTITTEGKLKGDPLKIATWHAIKDFKKIYALAIIYKLYGQPIYLQKATTYLIAWADTNQPGGNPINDTNLDEAIEGYDLIKSNIKAGDKLLISDWLKRTARAEIAHMPKNQDKETGYNNWNSHRLKVIGEIGFATSDTTLREFAVNALKKQLEVNLLPDGSSIDFKLRDALHYHVYDLEPLLQLAIVIKRAGGTDYYIDKTATGASLKKSTEWLLPYVTGAKTHGEFVHSTVKFDQDRARNGEAGYQAGVLFKPASGLKTLALAAYFDPSMSSVYQQVRGQTISAEDWQLMLSNIRN
ncbi:alginate lyase family protein [Pedobacter sp. L105]|uniref:alginate lyase family protein n=1 Tax=Pedobacter sp. L105 TaxID=1641871 RepID=UPI00131AFDE6|nr:alginate lyase family protein [Pedobacter sp. L105]